MNINFHKSFWEAQCNTEHDLIALLKQIKTEGYQGSELFLPFYSIDKDVTLEAHKALDLSIITGIGTQGSTVDEHIVSMNTQIEKALSFNPVLINSHTGRDIFSLNDNLKIFEHALSLEQKHGIRITHETHRFRPTFSTLGTEQLIKHLPALKLNLDISHWMVVHESDLSDQTERLEKLFEHVHHIHARVGYEEGPQVTDPANSQWSHQLENHCSLWQKVLTLAESRKEDTFTITPEFGPFPYAHTDHDGNTLTNIWQANLFMKNTLTDLFK
jgi:sugar phosphate isomerase/epimerase